MAQQSQFFATKDDLLKLTGSVEQKARLRYILLGNFESAELQSFDAAMVLPNYGLANTGSSSGCPTYLVCSAGARIEVRSISLKSGGTRYAVDQLVNPDTITFMPAGVWTDEILIAGRVATASNTSAFEELMRLFRAALRTHFKKVKAFYVGPIALGYLNAGKRLTYAEQSPREFDLTV